MATTSNGIVGQLREQVEALPTRSRVLLAVLLILVGVVWMLGVWWYTTSDLRAQSEDLSQRQKTLRNLQVLQLQYVDANNLIAEAEQRLGSKKQNPSAFIEAKAQEANVREQLRRIEKLGSETRGSLKETRYRVSLQKAPLEGTMKLVHDIETAGFLSTEDASFKTAFVKGDKLLTTDLNLIAYELVEEE